MRGEYYLNISTPEAAGREAAAAASDHCLLGVRVTELKH